MSPCQKSGTTTIRRASTAASRGQLQGLKESSIACEFISYGVWMEERLPILFLPWSSVATRVGKYRNWIMEIPPFVAAIQNTIAPLIWLPEYQSITEYEGFDLVIEILNR